MNTSTRQTNRFYGLSLALMMTVVMLSSVAGLAQSDAASARYAQATAQHLA